MQTDQLQNAVRIRIPPFYAFMATPAPYKSVHGGRDAARSWTFARLLIGLAKQKKLLILCCREYQSSMKDSVHALLKTQIELLGLSSYFIITQTSIKSTVGSEFLFKGLKIDPMGVKSTEGIDICWVEEAQSVSEESWALLIPTIRKEGSELWLSWNTGEVKDPTYQRFVINPPDDCISVKATWRDNPYFSEKSNKDRLHCLRVDKDAYQWIWEGEPKTISDAIVFKNKFIIDEFEAPEYAVFYQGADWGFSDDPTTLIRCYIGNGLFEGNMKNHLYVDYEAYGVGVELTEIAQLFNSVPDYISRTIRGDNSRPETISYLHKEYKLKIEACDKWKGSVEDGIAFLRKFEMIHIHQRCRHTSEEFKLYSYKQDSKSNEILPIIIDKHNHCIDPLRYALDKKIRNKGFDWTSAIG